LTKEAIMATNDAKLEIFWGSGSPNAWRALLAAEIKRIPYESRLLEFSKGDHKKPEFLSVSPRGKMPALRDGDFTLSESMAILAYLDRKQPEPPLFGRNPREAGRIARAIWEFECYLRTPLEEALWPILHGTTPENTARVRTAIETVRAELAKLEESATGPWLVGEALSAADIAIYPFLKLLVRAAGKEAAKPLDLGLLPWESRYPRLAAWNKRIEALPGYDRTYPPHWR
jgi:glutathione S-transferase